MGNALPELYSKQDHILLLSSCAHRTPCRTPLTPLSGCGIAPCGITCRGLLRNETTHCKSSVTFLIPYKSVRRRQNIPSTRIVFWARDSEYPSCIFIPTSKFNGMWLSYWSLNLLTTLMKSKNSCIHNNLWKFNETELHPVEMNYSN